MTPTMVSPMPPWCKKGLDNNPINLLVLMVHNKKTVNKQSIGDYLVNRF
jgi:hypothetical protein